MEHNAPIRINTRGHKTRPMHASTAMLPLGERENLEEIIRITRSKIAWPLRETLGDGGFAVRSDPGRREHVIYWPRYGGDGAPHYLKYLHELVHARLAEKAHPLFSGPAFAPGSHIVLVDAALPVFQAASDWFVEHEMVRLCPERKKPELAAQFGALLHGLRDGGSLDPAEAACAALLAAKAVAFLGREACLSGLLAELIQAYLRTPAHKPCLFTLRALTNRLLDPLFKARADIALAGGREVWLLRDRTD
ncbi:hypothetical protein PCS_01928 [Desulfocurvibacter africanus PCS]|uniref:Uncharacterized protein n=2 Tax=Desulfocurvibacter africanus TaxID=873 RepID=M5PTQ9_DESAF|nr:hypothetical protein PCS_01928 [Desulfocurvibacter africanus PCS]